MKYIKLYEKRIIKKYWLLLSTGRLFEISLMKIKCDEKRIQDFLNNNRINRDYVFIAYDSTALTHDKWGWMPYEGSDSCWYYDKTGFKFMGKVELDDWEKGAVKYNL